MLSVKTLIIVMALGGTVALAACQAEPQIVKETEIVVMTQEVPVTVEVTREVTVIVTPTPTDAPPSPTRIPIERTLDDDPYTGSPDAPIKLVEFSDYQCSYCARFYENTLYPLLAEYGEDTIQFVYRDFPNFGQASLDAAIAAECSADQDAFWAYHDRLFARLDESPLPPLNDDTLTAYAQDLGLDLEAWNACRDDQATRSEIARDTVDAQSWGVSTTPTFFLNGRKIVGVQPIETFIRLINEELDP